MKFYFVKFTHKETGKVFYKFGVTKESQVDNRFDPYFKNSRFYKDRYKYLEFDVRVLFSMYCNTSDAYNFEHTFKAKYPKNFLLENYLGKPYNYFSDGFTGITETVVLDDFEYKKVLQELYSLKNRY